MNTTTTFQANGKASTVKTTFSRETGVSIPINAAASIVWALLTNASDYTRWNTTITAMEGTIQVGSGIRLKSVLDAKRTFKLKVKSMDTEKQMIWGDAQGNRVYTISEQANGTVIFTMVEKIVSLFFPMYAKYIPPFDGVFEQFAADLKKEAETIAKTK